MRESTGFGLSSHKGCTSVEAAHQSRHCLTGPTLLAELDPLSECFLHVQVVEAVVLGRATLHKIRQNLAWALMYNVVGIPLAAGALLPTMGFALNASAAGGLMAVSSLAVVSNSLLLRTYNLEAGAEKALAAPQQQQQGQVSSAPRMQSSSSGVH